jgi:hypothetical protein
LCRIYTITLSIYIATNIPVKKNYRGITFLHIKEEIAKLNIETKLYLDTFLQTEETLYIDADSLCYGSLYPIFDACRSMDVTVLGKSIALEDYWGIEGSKFAKTEFGIDQSILFNGGLYFLKKNSVTTKIYDKARKISEKYDEYGFTRIQNNWKNEEELVSISMISNGQRPINHDGEFVANSLPFKNYKNINILTGTIRLNQINDSESQNTRNPILLHFGGKNIDSYLYRLQITLLKFNRIRIPKNLTYFLVDISMNIPYKLYRLIKDTGKTSSRYNK